MSSSSGSSAEALVSLKGMWAVFIAIYLSVHLFLTLCVCTLGSGARLLVAYAWTYLSDEDFFDSDLILSVCVLSSSLDFWLMQSRI